MGFVDLLTRIILHLSAWNFIFHWSPIVPVLTDISGEWWYLGRTLRVYRANSHPQIGEQWTVQTGAGHWYVKGVGGGLRRSPVALLIQHSRCWRFGHQPLHFGFYRSEMHSLNPRCRCQYHSAAICPAMTCVAQYQTPWQSPALRYRLALSGLSSAVSHAMWWVIGSHKNVYYGNHVATVLRCYTYLDGIVCGYKLYVRVSYMVHWWEILACNSPLDGGYPS